MILLRKDLIEYFRMEYFNKTFGVYELLQKAFKANFAILYQNAWNSENTVVM